jgi:hypothetical protein
MFPMQDQGGYFAEGQRVITKVKMNKGKPDYEGYEVGGHDCAPLSGTSSKGI